MQLVPIPPFGGHFTLFAHFTPYLASMAGTHPPGEVNPILLLIGLAVLSGGHIGDWLAGCLGHRCVLRLVPAALALALMAMLLSLGSIGFLLVLMAWSAISWMILPVVQSFLPRSDSASGFVGAVLNTSAMHLGVGFGAASGDLVVAVLGVVATPWVGLAPVLTVLAYAFGASTPDGAMQALPLSPPAR